jgi:hypothetical protein
MEEFGDGDGQLTPFGAEMREKHFFLLDKDYVNLNHGMRTRTTAPREKGCAREPPR